MRTVSFILLLVVAACSQNNKAKQKVEITLDEQIKKDPNNVELLVKRARIAIDKPNFEQALADAAKAFRLDSNNNDARLTYAEILVKHPSSSMQDIARSQRHYHVLIKKDPKNLAALVGLAATYSMQEDYEKSFTYINQALRADKTYRDAYVLKGSNYLRLGKIPLAKSSYETAVQQDPKFYQGYLMLGSLYQAEQQAVCLQYYTTAAKIQPKNKEVLYALAYAKQQFGEEQDALRIYRKMIQLDSTFAEALFQQGYIKQFIQNQPDSAQYYYESALQTNPDFPQAWHNIGLLHKDRGDKVMALKSFGKALKIDPEFALSLEEVEKLSGNLR